MTANDNHAQEFVRALSAFREGDQQFPELLQELDRILVSEPAARLDLLAALLEDDSGNALSTEVFEALQRRLQTLDGAEDAMAEVADHDDTVIEQDDFTDIGGDPAPAPGPDRGLAAGIGAVLNERYELVERIGVGGTSVVYKATDLQAEGDDTSVAIKILKSKLHLRDSWVSALEQEARKCQQLDHPGIVKVRDFGRDGTTVYLVMEYLPGSLLSEEIRSGAIKNISQSKALRIVNEMGGALGHAHQQGIIHCDFKPANVLLTSSGEVKIIDFGIASAPLDGADGARGDADYRPTPPNALTPVYASPQRLQRDAPDARDDIFSLACTAYELLTGVHPFGRMRAVAARNAGVEVRRLALGEAHWKALKRAMAFDLDARTPSVAEFLAEFNKRAWYATPLAGGIAALLCVGIALAAYNLLNRVDAPEEVALQAVEPAEPSPAEKAWQEAQLQLQTIKGEQRLLVSNFESQLSETEKLRQELEAARAQLAQRREEIEAVQQQLQLDQRQALEAHDAEMQGLETRVTGLHTEVEERKRENEMLARQNEEQRAQLLTSVADLQRMEQRLQEELDVHRNELQAAQTALQDARTELDLKRSDENRTAGEVERLEARVSAMQATVDDERRRAVALEQRNRTERAELLSRVEGIQQDERQLQATLQERNEQLTSLQVDLTSLRVQQSRLERETQAQVRSVTEPVSLPVPVQVPAAESSDPVPPATLETASAEPPQTDTHGQAIEPQPDRVEAASTSQTVGASEPQETRSVAATQAQQTVAEISRESLNVQAAVDTTQTPEQEIETSTTDEPQDSQSDIVTISAETAGSPQLQVLLARGKELMRLGDFAAARLVFELAAEQGSLDAAAAISEIDSASAVARPAETVATAEEPSFDAAPSAAIEESPSAQTVAPPPADLAGIEALLARGRELLQLGDFAAARLLFELAAEQGSAEAATAVGTTYDPAYIQEAGIQGAFPDLARALEWYERAVEAGDEAASVRLDKLNAWREAAGL